MTRLLMIPQSYNSVRIDGTNEIDAQSFKLALPKVKSKIVETAGGNLLDLNYGQGAALVPSPFEVMFKIKAASALDASNAFNNFFGIPPTGFYGETHKFKALIHGTAIVYTMDCEMSDLDGEISADWYKTTKFIFSNIKCVFTPVNLPYIE